MILGIGVDILSLARIEGVLTRRGGQRLAQRILCSREYEEFLRLDHATWTPDSHGSRGSDSKKYDPELLLKHVRFLSPRWAVKEAAYKALPEQTQKAITWRDLDLRYKPTGAPTLSFAETFKKDESSGVSFMPTISHDYGSIVGVVLALKQ